MKIFQAVDNPYNATNQYVMTLIDGINAITDDIEWGWGIDKFWQNDILEYDITHIHWPDALLWVHHTPKQIEDRLQKLQRLGIKIVATCHNIEPHYCTNQNQIESYRIVYNKCDMMIHLGNFSYKLMLKEYPHVKHVILPHQIYDTFYSRNNDKRICCKSLNINSKNEYLLCFGAFRDDEEREMVQKIAMEFIKKNIYILAPSYETLTQNGLRDKLKSTLKKIHLKRKHIICSGYGNGKVPIEMTPYYYGASSIAIIQRKRILNSGILPLAFLMGKVVVGPNIGNVGLLLTETGNPTFDINDDDSIIKAVNKARMLAKNNFGENNTKYALEHFSTQKVSTILFNYYKSLFT